MQYNGHMHTYFNDVNDWLSVGGDLDLARDVTGQPYEASIEQLRAHGVTHVLDVRSEWSDARLWAATGLPADNYCHAPITDSWSHIPSEDWFSSVEDFVERFWLESFEGDRLYVHCHMGINRAPSASMVALLTVDPYMSPLDAFLTLRKVRPAAGVVYAEAVGIRHLLNVEGVTAEDLQEAGELPAAVRLYSTAMQNYWTPELRESVHRGIAYFRSSEGGTKVVDGALVS